jgi:hypothetical protein
MTAPVESCTVPLIWAFDSWASQWLPSANEAIANKVAQSHPSAFDLFFPINMAGLLNQSLGIYGVG